MTFNPGDRIQPKRPTQAQSPLDYLHWGTVITVFNHSGQRALLIAEDSGRIVWHADSEVEPAPADPLKQPDFIAREVLKSL
jgi:hypothetical protein